MKISECNHIRIRDGNAYGANVEELIKFIEKKYKIDFRSLPQWKDLVKRLHVMTTDCKRKIEDANQRKYVMISKILVESTRDSPFALTDKLARTYNKWRMLETAQKKSRRVSMKPEPDFYLHPSEEIIGEISENTSIAHQNTEIFLPELLEPEPVVKSDVETETEAVVTSHLPVSICINQHKLISPLRSQEVIFDYYVMPQELETVAERESKEWLLLNQTESVKCFPKEICITNTSPSEQIIKFSVVNCTTEYMNIRFMCITDDSPFKRIKIIPATPKRLYPGIALTFKFVFKLFQNVDEFSSMLYFRVGQKVLEEAPVEALCIPIQSKFKLSRQASVSKAVHIPPAYLWQIREDMGFPTGKLKISVNDSHSYHLHITKRIVNISRECQDSIVSIDVISPNTESLIERVEDNEIVTESKILAALKENPAEEIQSIKTADIIALVVEDIVDLAVDTFVFDNTYKYLEPHSKTTINVSFTKPERIGSHHHYYDLEFCDTTTDEVIITKIVKVFAEVLPHPIQIYPRILDMSKSPITHGFCEDDIVITNTHRLYPVTIKFKLTTKMKKLFCITPMESLVPAKSSMKFAVKLCSKDTLSKDTDELAHFTFKIIVLGHKSVYHRVPPFFYEIIAPCASEFKKVYNEKYFRDE
ncbi:uncharacterized protein LOC114359660 [Ostrinia furnacalis]|uniref:uncharacterized protein LOC114359660 n=1 Tax=Ostrinia furnacalis TaxID=93504 RepID=UPI00103D101F|nr:uncharacterized protein LOC114359660 [Ostrinia furnacalis]